MYRHAELLCESLGPDRGVVDFRKHVAWYLKGFSVSRTTRQALALAGNLPELGELLNTLERHQPFPTAVLGQPRGRTSHRRAVALPDGWLTDRDSRAVPFTAELEHSGG
jgi:hypothetical protein